MLMLKLGGTKAGLRPSPSLISYAALALSLLVFLIWRLGSLTPGLSSDESLSRSAAGNTHGLLSNPVNAPYRLVQHLLNLIHPGTFSLRLASSIFAITFALFFYAYIRGLFGRIIGLFGAMFLISLPFYTISARQGTAQIMFFLPAVLICLYAALLKSERKAITWIALILAVGIGLYTPGMIWWVVGAAALARKKLSAAISALPVGLSGFGIGLLCLMVTPLVIISALHLQNLRVLAGIPAKVPVPLHFGAELLRMLGALVARSPGNNPLLLGTLPILNITLVALAVLGGYALFSAARDKAISLGLNIILAVVLAALNENVVWLALTVPALLILVTAGLRYLYVEWRSIFPLNPVPKTFALVFIAVVAASQLYYAADYSLQAWPHSPSVRKAYVLK